MDHNKLQKILREMGKPPYLPPEKPVCRWRSHSSNQTQNRLVQSWERSVPGCIQLPCLFKAHAAYILWNAVLNELQAGIKIAGRNVNNLRYANGRKWGTKDPLDEGERQEWKTGLELNIQKTKIMASGSITSWQIDGEKMETVTDFIFLDSKNHFAQWLQPWN